MTEQIKEAIEHLEKAKRLHKGLESDPLYGKNASAFIDFALALLRAEEPEPIEFTKRFRDFIKLSEEHLSKS